MDLSVPRSLKLIDSVYLSNFLVIQTHAYILMLISDICQFRDIEVCFSVHVQSLCVSVHSHWMSFLSSPQVMNREAMRLFQLC